MFHPAELERRHQQEVELAERIGNAGVLLEPRERRGVQIEDRVAVARDLLGVGLAVEHAERAAVALGGLDLELAGREGEEIRRERLRFRESQASAITGMASRAVSAPLASASHAAGISSDSV